MEVRTRLQVLVTGGGSPVARAVARTFAAAGHEVTLAGSFAELPQGGGTIDEPGVRLLQVDPTLPEAIERACTVADGNPLLDVLVTVPERSFPGGVEALDAATIDLATAHLLRAPMLYTRAALPLLRRSATPAVVHVAPVEAFLFGTDALQSALLNALINYTRQCVPQLPGIRLNAACPGGQSTPEQVAALVEFLASARAGYVNSAVVTVDGGWYATHPRVMPQ
ncbi:MAG: SDR family NAD(P)-dependent oxidoreductase [Gammaproteobacteria bacterium]